MKKIIPTLLLAAMALLFCACGKSGGNLGAERIINTAVALARGCERSGSGKENVQAEGVPATLPPVRNRHGKHSCVVTAEAGERVEISLHCGGEGKLFIVLTLHGALEAPKRK